MSNGVFSGIEVEQVRIIHSGIWVSPDGREDSNASLAINTEAEHSTLEDGMWTLPMTMKIDVEVYDDEDEDVAHFHLVLATAVSGHDFDGCTQGHADKLLGIHAVNHLYLFARSHIEYVTSMSTLGRFSIPDVNPARVLNQE